MFVYTIQPFVKPIVKPVWQPVVSCIQTFNWLSNPLDKRLYRVYSRLSNQVVQPVWQPCWTNSLFLQHNPVERTVAVRSTRLSNPFDNRLYRVYEHSTGCQIGLTTGWMFVYTIQPAVKPVVQPVVPCKRGITVTSLQIPCRDWRRKKCKRWVSFGVEYSGTVRPTAAMVRLFVPQCICWQPFWSLLEFRKHNPKHNIRQILLKFHFFVERTLAGRWDRRTVFHRLLFQGKFLYKTLVTQLLSCLLNNNTFITTQLQHIANCDVFYRENLNSEKRIRSHSNLLYSGRPTWNSALNAEHYHSYWLSKCMGFHYSRPTYSIYLHAASS